MLALLLLAGYVLGKELPNPLTGWLDAGHHFVTGVLTVWWALLLGRLTLGRGVAQGEYLSRVQQVLTFTFPLLTTFRGVLWGITALGMAGGTVQAHPVALTGLMTIWGASIIASYMCFFWLVRWAELGPKAARAKGQLEDWLNLSAALTLGMTVVNVVPTAGFSVDLSQTDQLAYGGAGLLDIAATLLALQAVRLTRLPQPDSR